MRKLFNKSATVFVIAFLVFTLSGCGNSTSAVNSSKTQNEKTVSSKVQTPSDSNLRSFTKEELKKYDGQNGNPAYVAVDGKVYDVTNVRGWNNGQHNGFKAGNDLTEAIKTKSPHGLSVLSNLKVVGKLEG